MAVMGIVMQISASPYKALLHYHGSVRSLPALSWALHEYNCSRETSSTLPNMIGKIDNLSRLHKLMSVPHKAWSQQGLSHWTHR